MKVLFAADIYGNTPQLQALVEECCPGARILSPWEGEGCPQASEAEAHAAFLDGGGVETYAERLTRTLGNEPALLVGFSAGATAGWLHAAQLQSHPASRALLFYGSRIRLYPELRPRFPVELICAAHEAAFDPAALAAELARPNVRVEIAPDTEHGFMNPLSPGFSPQAFQHYCMRLRQEHDALFRG